ncbi:hypothetical protein ACU8V7_08925 [Zobellia nedashkovskayae]
MLLKCYPEDEAFKKTLEESMMDRKNFLTEACWNPSEGIFEDFNWVESEADWGTFIGNDISFVFQYGNTRAGR